jgi:hypothetical protein
LYRRVMARRGNVSRAEWPGKGDVSGARVWMGGLQGSPMVAAPERQKRWIVALYGYGGAKGSCRVGERVVDSCG